jgi:hypothetical protein
MAKKNRKLKKLPSPAMSVDETDPHAPTRERKSHGAIETIRVPGAVTRRAQPPIERYLKRGSITRRQHDAGEHLVDDYELGVHGAKDPDKHGNSGRGSPLSEAQLMALRAYTLALRSLHPRVQKVILAAVIEERDAKEIAAAQSLTPEGAMDILRIGLDDLARSYEISLDE